MDLSNMLPLSVVWTEVQRVARGERSRVPVRILCESLAHYLIFLSAADPDEAGPSDNNLADWCEALFKLEDPRHE